MILTGILVSLRANNNFYYLSLINVLKIKLMKQKRFYEKPQMEVFELKQQPQILAGSDKGMGGLPGMPIQDI